MNPKMMIAALVVVTMSSCVSKKNFLAMQDTYMTKTDSLISVTDDLNSRLVSGEVDFEATKQDFLINDAGKNDKISDLEIQLKELQTGFDEVSNSLADSKDRVKMTQDEKDQASYQLARMNSDLATLRQDTVSLNYALKLQRRKSTGLQNSLDMQINKYTKESSSHRTEVQVLKKDAETSKLKTKELERQLALKQKEIENVNTAFIALRKDLLRAKAKGEILDPGTSATVNALAKSLGQY